MKTKNIIWSLLAALTVPVAGLLTSCNNAEADAITNRVYIAEATSSAAAKIAVEQEGAKIPFTVRMADVVANQDVRVKVQIDPSVLDAYNQTNQTQYEVLPKEYYSFETDEAVIKAGQVLATQTIINVGSFTTGGKNYALPVSIASVDGPIGATNTSSKFVFILDKPLIVKTPILKGATDQGVVAGPLDDATKNPIPWNILTNTWTLEGWVRMSGYTKNNQALFTSGSGDHEIYIRFGDATPTNPKPDPNNPRDRYNYMQIKTLGSQVNTGFLFVRNKWYHFALTYDGKMCTIYTNGEKTAEFAPPSPKGGIVRIDQMTMIGSGSTWFVDNCNLSQVRMWKVALTQAQINNNKFYELDASNPDMIAYWKMDEGEGKNFKDATGNGHDAVAGNGWKGWTDYTRFDK